MKMTTKQLFMFLFHSIF